MNSSITSFKLLSMNVRGIRNNKKRKSLFYQFKKDGYAIVGIQDTHLTFDDKETIKSEWGDNFHMVEGTNRSKGLLTLYSKDIDPKNVSLLYQDDRCLITSITTEHSVIAIINIYGPCPNNEKCIFLNKLNASIVRVCD